MALSLRLNLRPGQSLVMTPKLQQAIRPLQLSNLELSEFVEEALQNNPLLEREDTGEYKFKAEPSQDRYATEKIQIHS
jgi:RNA polymerase sigma-54 factor